MNKKLKRLRDLLLYGGLTKTSYADVKPMVEKDNLWRLQFYSLFATIFFAVITVLYIRFYQETYANKTLIANGYGLMVLIMLVLALMSRDKKAILQGEGAGVVLRYIFCAVLYAFTIYMSVMHPADAATALVVTIVTVPMLFAEVPVRQIAMTVIVSVVYLCMVFRFKNMWLAYLDLWYVVAFGFLSIILACGTARIRFHLFEQEQRVKILGETDVLTATMNRNKFESCQQEHARHPAAHIAYVYGDVNGLHELNNSKGHLAGDIMLKTVAAELTAAFGMENVYRMGGDEFVAFVPGKTTEEITGILSGIEKRLAEHDYHVSFGVARAERDGNAPFDVNALLTTAEKRMYDAKRAYYKNAAHDRRGRDR